MSAFVSEHHKYFQELLYEAAQDTGWNEEELKFITSWSWTLLELAEECLATALKEEEGEEDQDERQDVLDA